MSEAEERNNKRAGEEESIPTASFSGAAGVAGGQVGAYKLLRMLGEGGFAEVYLAEQQRPVKRRVALKVIKPGMDSKQVIARFEAERQALALLDHPNIAQVYDAGTTEAGRPYFVMECVKGVSLTEHCDGEKLSIEERLELFGQVCEAVQHAHQKGIIHRDIKPSNVLVSIEGEHALPKIIDFGVAKAITQPLTERTLFTEQGQMIGTPEYMSPEQAGMTAQDIDTRSDIYSLGVLLYELLTGALPFDRKTLEEAGFAEIQRIIREEDPPRPSTKLTDLGEEATKVAKSRRTEVATLARRLHKELEWIPLMAMRKERTHRYRSASEFADDIQNYLAGAPLIAGPESAAYRLKKFVRRKRALVTGIAAVLIVLVAGIVVSSIFAVGQARARAEADSARAAEAKQRQVAEAERDRAVEAERLTEQRRAEAEALRAEAEQAREKEATARTEAEQARQKEAAARDEAERQVKISQAVADFLNNDLLASVDPEKAKGREVTVREVLDAASEKIEGKFEGEPLVEASVRATLGIMYVKLGKYMEAELHIKHALKIHRERLGEEDWEALTCMQDLANLYLVQGRYDEAEQLNINVLKSIRRKFDELGDLSQLDQGERLHHWSWALNLMNNLGLLYTEQGRYDKAEPLLVDVLENRRSVLGEQHRDTLGSMNNLARLYLRMHRYNKAEPLLVEALEIGRQELGKEHTWVSNFMYNLSAVYWQQHRYAEAEPLLVEALEIRAHVLGEEHPETVACMNELGVLYWEQGRYDEAEQLYVKVLEIRRRVLGEEHLDTLTSMNMLTAVYVEQRRYKEAEPLLAEAFEASRRVLSDNLLMEDHAMTKVYCGIRNNLGVLYLNQRRYAEAEPLFVEAMETGRRVLGEENPDTLTFMKNLIQLYETWGKPEKAKEWRAELPGKKETEDR